MSKKITIENKGSVPKDRGLYWAKSDNHEWFNLIVNVEGEPPFLEVRNYLNMSLPGVDTIREWGPRIHDVNDNQ